MVLFGAANNGRAKDPSEKAKARVAMARSKSVREQIIAATRKQIARREKFLKKITNADHQVLARALEVFENASGAASWLLSPEISLGGSAPIDCRKESVLVVLGRIEHSIPP